MKKIKAVQVVKPGELKIVEMDMPHIVFRGVFAHFSHFVYF